MPFVVPGFGVGGADSKRQDSSSQSRNIAGELYPVGNKNDGILFQLNPESIQRRRTSDYAIVGAAAADYWSTYDGPSPLQWIRNPPEVISFDLMLFATGQNHVEEPLAKIRKMMSRSSRNPRGKVPGPPDLIFKYGPRSDTVRIMSASFNEQRHTGKLEVQKCAIAIELKTVTIGGR